MSLKASSPISNQPMSPSVYSTISGAVYDQLNRWSNEANTYAALWNKHPDVAECAKRRAKEAEIAFFALKKVQDELNYNNLI